MNLYKYDGAIIDLEMDETLPDIVLMGDSITDETADGDWVRSFKQIAKYKNLRNYARGYCTWTFKNDTAYNVTDTSNRNVGNNVIWNQFNRLKRNVDIGGNAPDAIIILAGTNDLLQNKTLGNVADAFTGSVLDKDITTLTNMAQSIRYTCECIKQEWPMCQLILCTPWSVRGFTSDYRNIIIECAAYLADATIDVWNESGIYYYFEQNGDVFKDSDNVHLNATGGKKVAEFMLRKLIDVVNVRPTE